MICRPEYLNRPFASKAEACEWVVAFVDWYIHRHRHSGIKFVTPNSVTVGPPRQFASSELMSMKMPVKPIQDAGADTSAAGINPKKCGSTSHQKSPNRSSRHP